MFALALITATLLALVNVVDSTKAIQTQNTLLDDQYYALVYEKVVRAVETFIEINGRFPVSLDEISESDDTGWISSLDLERVSYAIANDVEDGTNQFDRAMLVHMNEDIGFVEQDYIDPENNSCSSNAFDSAGSVCPSGFDAVLWESRANYNTDAIKATNGFLRTLRKFAEFYKAKGVVPNTGAQGVLNNGDVVLLADFVGFTGESHECTGQFSINELILSCSDLFTYNGQLVSYTYNTVSPSDASEFVESTLAAEMDYQRDLSGASSYVTVIQSQVMDIEGQ